MSNYYKMEMSQKQKMSSLFLLKLSSSWWILLIITMTLYQGSAGLNLPPYFREDLNNLVIPENTPVGTPVFTLIGVDPENSPLRYGIMGTDKLNVDEETGIVRLAKPIDREMEDQLKISVTVEDMDGNQVPVKNVIQIADVNDNPVTFVNKSQYETIDVVEDTRVGSRILSLLLQDPDLTGLELSLNCTPTLQSPEACHVFQIEVREASSGYLKADLKLGQKLDYNRRALYQFILSASDGEHTSTAGVLIRIEDVQNTPPVFVGAMSGRVMEDSPVGTLVMVIEAKDGDFGNSRTVRVSILTNPGDSFQLDPETGELTTTRPLDREILGSLLRLQVKAREIPRDTEPEGSRAQSEFDILETTANVSILIDDVNDFFPRFNEKEFITELNENIPAGTPLPDLDMIVHDEDSGTFGDFTLRIDGPLAELFDIEPKIVSGSARPVIRTKKVFDFENPNERKFLVHVIAQNTEEPELFSTCTVSLSINDENDNSPKFTQDFYTITVPESILPGTKIGSITAFDPDSKEYGNEGLLYNLVGSGSKKFNVNSKTGDITVAECLNAENSSDNHTVTVLSCLDFEAQNSYDFLFMASDSYKTEGFLHSVVPLHIHLSDSNDNPPYFDIKFSRTIMENARHFEPRFFITAKDVDKNSHISYKLESPHLREVSKYFQLDQVTGELTIKSLTLPPSNFTFNISCNDGTYTATTPVTITILDVNNNYPIFSSSLLKNLTISENSKIGTILSQIKATDVDFGPNGIIRYVIEAGSYGYFQIDPISGKIKLVGELDDTLRSKFDLVVSAHDLGQPPLRSTTVIHIQVLNAYTPLPKIHPLIQRAQVSESAKIGDFVTQVSTFRPMKIEDLEFEFITPMEARNVDNKAVTDDDTFKEWFTINNSGLVTVGAVLARELVTSVNLTVRLTSKKARPGSESIGLLAITIFDVNNYPPKIADVEIETFEELNAGMTILTLDCEDPEGGQISNYAIGSGADLFSIDNKTGEIKISGRLDFEDRPMYNLTVICVDSGVPQLSSTGTVMVSLLNINDNSPTFNQSEFFAEINEEPTEGTVVATIQATDADGDVIYYDIEPGRYSSAFRIDRLGQITTTKDGATILDRELLNSATITIGIRARDTEHHGFATLRVRILDVNDVPPTMRDKNYDIRVYAPLYSFQQILKMRADGGDTEEGTDDLHYQIVSGNDLGIFDMESKSGVIRAARAYEETGEFRLIVAVSDRQSDFEDQTSQFDRAGVLIRILPGNFRKPEFKFPNRVNSTLPVVESSEKEIEKFKTGNWTKVLGQVMAFDPDEGDAGEIKYYFKNGVNLVSELEAFRIEAISGQILQVKALDREERNRYNLVVVARDSGNPVSTETHEILNIIVEDIDDNLPKFGNIRVYNFSIKENSLENTFIGQVEAHDEDEGRNAQIFYFLVASPTNQHYIHHDLRVDIKTGGIYTNAVLDHERINSYSFFVRVSPSPMLNKSAVVIKDENVGNDGTYAFVQIEIQDLNDNSPRFPFREYFAGINSNSEPGREILTFASTDVDPSSQPFIQYSLLGSYLQLDEVGSGGAVLPSPFRVDGNTGRLTLSPTGMKRYAGGGNRFLVKVGVKETIPPFYQDTTQVRVWVVEDKQEAVVTIKTPPLEMLKTELIDLLGNITGRIILINKITPHVREDRSIKKNWTDVYISAVDKKSNQIVPVPDLLQALDLGHDRLEKSGVSIQLFSAVPAMGATVEAGGDGNFFFNDRESFDTAFAGLVALVALLCMGIGSLLAVCCCVNRMYSTSQKGRQLIGPGMKHPLNPIGGGGSIPGTPAMRGRILKPQPEMIEDLATDNPLWIDHKVMTYEEQELTMQVASDVDNSTNSTTEDSTSVDEDQGHLDNSSSHQHQHRQLQRESSSQFSHSYATIHHHPSDYDILGDDTAAVHL